MASTTTTGIISGLEFSCSEDVLYTKPKQNASGGKSIGLLNAHTKRGLLLNTPLMLTWGVNDYTDDKTNRTTYDMSLQFPKDEYSNEQCDAFLKNMLAFEDKLKADALKNSKEWLNKAKTTSEVIDALWTPMLKYPKDQESGEPDRSRAPTLRLKLPVWDGEWNCELYNMEQQCIFPNDSGLLPTTLITKATYVATVIQCGGLWFANGKFGVTWKLVQAVVKPKESLKGKCFIELSSSEKSQMAEKAGAVDDDDDDAVAAVNHVQVMDSSDEDDDDDGGVEVDVAAASNVKAKSAASASKVAAVSEVTAELHSLSTDADKEEAPAPKKKVVKRVKKTAAA